jgi:hypothetical protein
MLLAAYYITFASEVKTRSGELCLRKFGVLIVSKVPMTPNVLNSLNVLNAIQKAYSAQNNAACRGFIVGRNEG